MCEHCGKDLIAAPPPPPPPPWTPSPPAPLPPDPDLSTAPIARVTVVDFPDRPVSGGYILRKLLWSLSLIAMLIFAADGFFSFQIQTGAPQQAAAAGAACFHMITVYVIARALDELTRERSRF